jgi:acyl-CoA synthetase (AMP-forming)/AMP-acid ligase II
VIGISINDARGFLTALFAILKHGGIALPLDPKLKPDELHRLATDSGVAWIISPTGLERGRSPRSKSIQAEIPDAAVIRYTSGTTGRSKGVIISHQAINERTKVSGELLEVTADDIVLSPLALSYHFIASALTFIRYGAIILDTFQLSPADTIALAKEHGATALYASPDICLALADQGQPLPSLSRAIATSANLSPGVASEFQRVFGLRLTQVFGIIEVGLPIWNDQSNLDPTVLGRCRSPYHYRIIDRAGTDVACNQVGELMLSGPGIFSGYVSGSEGTISKHHNEWFATGDLVRQDALGNISFCGRKKSAITLGGERIFPEAIESVLREAENINLARVSVSDSSTLLAEVTLKDNTSATPNEWLALCRARLKTGQIPQLFKVVSEIPLTGSGKIVRYEASP